MEVRTPPPPYADRLRWEISFSAATAPLGA